MSPNTVPKPPITFRLIVPASQCGSLIGKNALRGNIVLLLSYNKMIHKFGSYIKPTKFSFRKRWLENSRNSRGNRSFNPSSKWNVAEFYGKSRYYKWRKWCNYPMCVPYLLRNDRGKKEYKDIRNIFQWVGIIIMTVYSFNSLLFRYKLSGYIV